MQRIHLVPRFGDMPMDKLTIADVEAMSVTLLKRRPATQDRPHDHQLRRRGVRARRRPSPRRSAAAGAAPPLPRLPTSSARHCCVLIRNAAMTGLRRSELAGLRWRDVDWAAQRIRVRHTYARGEYSSAGKSDLSTRRSVPMADRLVGELDVTTSRRRELLVRERRRSTCRCGSSARDARRARDGAHQPGLSPGGWRGSR